MTADIAVAVADTSGLIAFFNATDQHHQAFRNAIAAVGHLVVSPCVLAELDYLVADRQGPHPAKEIVRYIAGRVAAGRWEVPGVGGLLLAAHAVLDVYPGIGLPSPSMSSWPESSGPTSWRHSTSGISV